MTEYFEEMENFFEYDKEIVGYKDKNDLMAKLDYFINNPLETKRIAMAGQKKCKESHTWKMRLNTLFKSIELKTPELEWSSIEK